MPSISMTARPSLPFWTFVADGLLLFGSLVVGAADEALHGRDGVLRIGDRLVLRGLADDALAVLAEALHRRGGAIALGVHQNFGSEPSMTAMAEFVVPKSMPRILAIVYCLAFTVSRIDE